ncbi:unnamed protein product [Owenia fusiformis]|uniref:Sulfotransferase domain-containing protein n=1 Tax=Owenia fusiformis TaxID=6347 RepID=A0A8J1TEG3_OWEFU|nr:unnamed protein product [Owenia fusiformis]
MAPMGKFMTRTVFLIGYVCLTMIFSAYIVINEALRQHQSRVAVALQDGTSRELVRKSIRSNIRALTREGNHSVFVAPTLKPNKATVEQVEHERTEGNTKIPYILIADSRSGSTLLIDLLNQYVKTPNLGDLVLPDTLKEKNMLNGPGSSSSILAYLTEQLKNDPRAKYEAAPGFKLQCNSLRFLKRTNNLLLDELLQYLHKPKLILLYREDLMERYVSDMIGMQTGVWHALSEKTAEERGVADGLTNHPHKNTSIVIKWQDYLNYVDMTRNDWRTITQVMKEVGYGCEDFLMLTYESYTKDVPATMETISKFLQVPPKTKPYTLNLQKLDPEPLSEKIENFKDIEPKIRDSQREKLFLDAHKHYAECAKP